MGGALQPELIKGEVVKNHAIGGDAIEIEILGGVGRSFDLGFDDEAAADEIDNVAYLGMAAERELGAGEAARQAIYRLVVVEVASGKMEDAASVEFEEIMRASWLNSSTRKARSARKLVGTRSP